MLLLCTSFQFLLSKYAAYKPSKIADLLQLSVPISFIIDFMIKQFDHLYKTVIVGNSGVGKSSILVRFAENQFLDHYLATIGVDFRFKAMQVDGKNVKFQIWDTAGQERFRTITSAYYRGSQGILLVFDITDAVSFNDVCNFWMGEVEMYAEKDALLFLIGNKSDLSDHRAVSKQDIDLFCKKKGMNYIECSAKDDQKVKEIFTMMARKFMEKQNTQIVPTNSGSSRDRTQELNPNKGKPKKKCC